MKKIVIASLLFATLAFCPPPAVRAQKAAPSKAASQSFELVTIRSKHTSGKSLDKGGQEEVDRGVQATTTNGGTLDCDTLISDQFPPETRAKPAVPHRIITAEGNVKVVLIEKITNSDDAADKKKAPTKKDAPLSDETQKYRSYTVYADKAVYDSNDEKLVLTATTSDAVKIFVEDPLLDGPGERTTKSITFQFKGSKLQGYEMPESISIFTIKQKPDDVKKPDDDSSEGLEPVVPSTRR